MDRAALLPILFQLFRQYGYDGVSLSKISQETQLGKASLYHHFPNGKAEMLQAAIAYSQHWFEEHILQVLRADGTAEERLQQMCDRLKHFYAQGEQPCLMATLTTGITQSLCHEQVKSRLQSLIQAIATVLTEHGLAEEIAIQRAEDAIITIQGALILSRGLNEPTLFQRVVSELPQKLCKP
ncbi:MAG: TetR/AcrR family transcriptional regulator [Cyanobacteria bacterium J06650_10]